MINLTKEEAQQVLDALEVAPYISNGDDIVYHQKAIDTLRSRLTRDEIWAKRDLSKCECDHNEYCQHCWPVELRGEG